MMFSTFEIIQIVISTLALAYIFQDLFMEKKALFDRKAFLYSALLSTFSVTIHELAHKLTAISFGHEAVYYASFIGLGLGVALRTLMVSKELKLPIFFIPAFVSIPGQITPYLDAVISIAGPLSNLSLYLISEVILRLTKISSKFLVILSKINLLLFLFNMIPIFGTDGYHFFTSVMNMM